MARKILEIFKDVLIVVLALAIVVLTLLALPARTITSTPWLAAILRPVAPLFGLSQSELTYTGDVVADATSGRFLARPDAGRFEAATAQRMLERLVVLLTDVGARPETPMNASYSPSKTAPRSRSRTRLRPAGRAGSPDTSSTPVSIG